MNLFRLYLWKEWREQRGSLLLVLLMMPALLAFVAIVCEPRQVDQLLQPGVAAATGALFALLVAGADSMPSELRRDRVRFLERLPAGLPSAFLAKLSFFVTSTLLAALFGAIVAVGVFMVRHGHAPKELGDAASERFLLPAAAFVFWTFAVSIWVPHAALALPAAALSAGALCSPAWLFFGGDSLLVPTASELRVFCALSSLGAAISAWASFSVGLRRGGGPSRAGRIGVLVAALALAPAWAWCAYREHRAAAPDPGSPGFQLLHATIGTDGRHAFLAMDDFGERRAGLRDSDTTRGLVLDMQTREWRPIGSGPASLYATDLVWPADRCPRLRHGSARRLDHEGTWRFDTTGARVDDVEGDLLSAAMPEVGTLGLDSNWRPRFWVGLGLYLWDPAQADPLDHTWFDSSRARIFRASELFGGADESIEVWIRPQRWIVRRAPHARYELFDPCTRETSPLPELARTERPGPMLPDGRILLVRHRDLVVFSPEDSTFEALTWSDGAQREVRDVSSGSWYREPIGRADPAVARVGLQGGGDVLARLDLERRELVPTCGGHGSLDLVACESRDVVLAVEDRRRLVRLRFGGDERAVLFP